MVNSISGYNIPNAAFYRAAAGTAVLHKNDVENMVKFLNGQPITSAPEPTIGETITGTLPFMGIFGGFQAGGEIKKNNWSIKNTIAAVKASTPYTSRTDAITAGKDRIIKEYGNFFKKSVVVNPKRGYIGKLLDKLPGYTKLRATGFGQAMGKSGAGWMAVMDGAIETFTQVVPTFSQLGAEAGFKQIAKSGTKVIAGGAGWLAGDALGKGIGAAIGTAICPGVGTAIGGFVGGFLGGMIGSAIAGKVAKSVTGKNELEKAQEAQIAQAAQQIEADSQTKLALAQEAYQQAENILAQDPQHKDALLAKATAEKVIVENQIAQDTNATAAQQTQPAASANGYQQSFTGLNASIPPVPGFNGVSYDMNQYRQAVSHASRPAFNPMANSTANPFVQKQYQANQAV